MSTALRLLAIDSSTDTLSVAVGSGVPGEPCVQHTGPGAAAASASLLPVVHDVLAQRGWALAELDAIVYGRGPGSFTGLRTACAVAQGLAYGARSERHPQGVPVLGVESLHALAQSAWMARTEAGHPVPAPVAAVLDARMGEWYVALYACGPQGVQAPALQPPRLCTPAAFGDWLAAACPGGATPWLAGNVFGADGPLPDSLAGERQAALPTAAALLALAPNLLAQGLATRAHEAQPLYVRDKVAFTTAEREGQRA